MALSESEELELLELEEQEHGSQPTPAQPDTMLNRVADTLRPIGDAISQMGSKAQEMMPHIGNIPTDPIGMSFKANEMLQVPFDVAGEKLTEKMGGSRIPGVSNPYVAAGAGMLTQNLPAIAQGMATARAEPMSRPSAPNPLFKKAMSWAADVPEDSVGFRMQNPKLVQNAQPLSELAANEVPGMAGKFDQVIKGLHGEAKKTLSTSPYIEQTANDVGGAFTKDEVLGALKDARKKLGGVYTPEAQTASNTLARVSENLNKIRSTVSQNQVHDLIMDLDNEIPWDKVTKSPESLTLQDNALIDTRTRLDALLKTKNPTYAQIMKPLAEAIQNRNEFTRNFGVQKVKGQGYQPGNQTVSRMLGATNEDRLATKRILGKTKETIGEDLTPKVEASQVKAQFEPDSGGVFNPNGVKQIFGRPAAAKVIDANAALQEGLSKTPSLESTASAASAIVKKPSREVVRQFLDQANGDRDLARKLAKKAGYSW